MNKIKQNGTKEASIKIIKLAAGKKEMAGEAGGMQVCCRDRM